MIEFIRSMDPHSLGIARDGKEFGYLQWHKDRSPRIVLRNEFDYLTITEMEYCIEKFKEAKYGKG
jgi:hypothetical protein